MENNTEDTSYVDILYKFKSIQVPNITYLNMLFQQQEPSGYPVENSLSLDTLNKFLRTKRYIDSFLMPGYEVYLNNGDLIDVSNITSNTLAGSAPTIFGFNNFWKMIWEQNVRLILSLTPWMENGIIKADRYFPLIGKAVTFTNIRVRTENNVILMNNLSKILGINIASHDIKILELKLTNISTDETRTLYHIHYARWQDNGVPTIGDMHAVLLVFSYLTNHLNSINNIKSFIHCSAGIGRTGTFIMLCAAITQINGDLLKNNLEGSINLLDILTNLREKRKGLVQNQQQLKFIVEYLSVYLSDYVSKGPNTIIDLHVLI